MGWWVLAGELMLFLSRQYKSRACVVVRDRGREERERESKYEERKRNKKSGKVKEGVRSQRTATRLRGPFLILSSQSAFVAPLLSVSRAPLPTTKFLFYPPLPSSSAAYINPSTHSLSFSLSLTDTSTGSQGTHWQPGNPSSSITASPTTEHYQYSWDTITQLKS